MKPECRARLLEAEDLLARGETDEAVARMAALLNCKANRHACSVDTELACVRELSRSRLARHHRAGSSS